jgi:single-strand DNA-binding protein
MQDLNLTITGNLTDDPELRFTPSGAAVCKFTVAHTPRVPDKANAGQYKDGEATFIGCTVWRDQAEHVAESLTRGARVIVVGRLRTERWDDKTSGEKRSRIVLDVEEVGPSLRWATAAPKKMTRTRTGGDQEWQQASRTKPTSPAPAGASVPAGASAGTAASWDEEPPF